MQKQIEDEFYELGYEAMMQKLTDEELFKVAHDALQQLYKRGCDAHEKCPFGAEMASIRHTLETLQNQVNKAVFVLTGGDLCRSASMM